MPVYEYRCGECGQKSPFFTRSVNALLEPQCPHCESSDMQRAVSSFSYHKSAKTIHDEYGPPPPTGVPSLDYYKDPRNIGRHVEEAFQKYDVEMPASVKDSIDAAREGKLPAGLDL